MRIGKLSGHIWQVNTGVGYRSRRILRCLLLIKSNRGKDMATLHKICTKPTLLQRIKRSDSTAAMLVLLWLFSFIALANLICWMIGVGDLGVID